MLYMCIILCKLRFLFITPLLIVLPYTSIQSDLFTTPPLVVLPYTSIQSDPFTTSTLVVLPYNSIQSDLFTISPLVVLPYNRYSKEQTNSERGCIIHNTNPLPNQTLKLMSAMSIKSQNGQFFIGDSTYWPSKAVGNLNRFLDVGATTSK